VALVADIDSLEGDSDRVPLMTLHSAKGLEFENVYLAGMDQGIFPTYHAISSEDSSDLEEERRLCYVGITRAKRFLTLTSAQTRLLRGEMMWYKVSDFVDEIPEELLDDNRWTESGASDEGTGGSLGEKFGSLSDNVKAAAGSLSHKLTRAQAMKRKEHEEFSQKPFYLKASQTASSAAGKGKGNVAGLRTGADLRAGAALEYAEGDRVSHVKFGEGTVREIREGGRDKEVTVEFDNFGVKKMFAAFAKLKKLDR
jgi:DNA helicase-2/ATP-dependent DNA helicase PcrA